MFNVTLPAMIRGRLAFLVMLLVLPHVAAQAAETVPSAKTDMSLKSDLSPKSDLSLKRDLPKTTGKTSALFPMADLPAKHDLNLMPGVHQVPQDAIVTKSGISDLTRERTIRIEPTSAVSDFADAIHANLEKDDVSTFYGYNASTFFTQSRAIIWDIAAIYGGVTYFGINNWEWGSSGFQFENEGWFGEDTKYGGMDKIGHAYTGYILTEYFSQRIAHEVDDPNGAIITGAILGMGVQTYIEFFDGFSGGHGFSYEDLIADAVGVGFSVLRNTVPEVAEKLDFRLEYIQSEYSDFAPVTDYAGQKYVLALKLAGFEDFEETPLRFFEVQAGYFTQGYTDAEREAGVSTRRQPYVAIGLNLNELLHEAPDLAESTPGLAASRAFEYIQVPYTYVPTASR